MSRTGKISLAVLAALAIVLGALYLARKPIAAAVIVRVLEGQGLGPASFSVTRFDAGGFKIEKISAADGALRADAVDVSYTFSDLRAARVDAVAVAGLTAALAYDDAGLRLGQYKIFPGAGGGGALALPLRRLDVPGAALEITLPDGALRGGGDVSLAPSGAGFDVTLNAKLAGERTMLDAAWAGYVAAALPQWNGKGSLAFAITNRQLPLVAARASARGSLAIAAADGVFTARGDGPLALGLGGLAPQVTANFPADVLDVLGKRDLTAALTGSRGGLLVVMSGKGGAATTSADVELAATVGKSSLRAVLRGEYATQDGAFRDMKIDVLTADLLDAPLPFAITPAPVTARLRLTRAGGSLEAAAADVALTAATSRIATAAAVATGLNAAVTARLSLEGGKLDIVPTTARIAMDGIAAPGPAPAWRVPAAAANLAQGANAPRSLLTVENAGGARRLRFDITAATENVALIMGEAAPFSLDLPRLRVRGDAPLGQGSPNVTLTAEGILDHALLTLDQIAVDGRMDADGYQGAAALRLARLGGEDASSPFASMPASPGLRAESKFRIDAAAAEITADLAAAGTRIGQARVRAAPDFSRGDVTIDLPERTLGAGVSLQDIFSSGLPLTDAKGSVAVALKAAWTKDAVAQTARVLLKDLGFAVGSLTVDRLNAAFDLDQIWPPRAKDPQIVSAAAITAGLPFTNLEARITLAGDNTARVDSARLDLAGGNITATNTTLPLDGSDAALALTVSNVDAGALAAQFEVDGLKATGTLAGSIPVRVAGGDILVENADLHALAPGTISYRPKEAPAGLASAESSALLLQALANFHYDSLALTLNGSVIGDVSAGIALKGKNPDLYGGYPIEFNLNLGGKLTEILRQGLVGYRIPAEVEERMRRLNMPDAQKRPDAAKQPSQ